MARFFAGFFSASLVWAAVLYAQSEGYLDLGLGPIEVSGGDETSQEASGASAKRGRRRSGRKWRGRGRSARGRSDRRTLLTGDDLGEDEVRSVDMVGGSGEGQLTSHEVELGIDGALPRIRRCLVLVADEDPLTGRVTFGMRISGNGRVTKVNLRGPSPLVDGEAGSCLRAALRGIQYRTFDGPDMVVHYPFTLR